MLLLAASFAASTINEDKIRVALLGLFGVLLGLSGLQSVVFLVAFAVFCGSLLPKRYRASVTVVTCAAIGGTVLMMVVMGLLNLNHAGYTLDMFFKYSILGTFLSPEHSYSHRFNIPKSPSFALLLVFLALMIILSKKTTAYSRFALISFFAISGTFVFFAHLPTYYAWFAVIPTVTALVADINNRDAVQKRVLTGTLISICLVGLPLQLGSSLLYKNGRDYRTIDVVLRHNLNASDCVYSDYSAYYAVKSICPKSSFFGDYIHRMSNDEKQRIDILVVTPLFATNAEEILGGSWGQEVRLATPINRPWFGWSFGVGLLESQYDLVLLRRLPERF